MYRNIQGDEEGMAMAILIDYSWQGCTWFLSPCKVFIVSSFKNSQDMYGQNFLLHHTQFEGSKFLSFTFPLA